MKNNEYNIVNITNEKNNFSGEYTNAQKVEYSFQPENKNPIKDELNDNSTINDKVEDNLLKSTREKEKKKEKQESEALESSSSSSGSASSSTASSTAAASSGGASGALGGIVAAATVSVVAIGTIVGINVFGAQPTDLVTFLTSEVTANSIDYSFSMSSQLLHYNEGSGDMPVGQKTVVATISDGLSFKDEEYLFEYEEYDENTFIFYHGFSGLTPDTAYALTLKVREENSVTETYNDTQLAYRTFRTDVKGEALKFESVIPTSNSVSFSFIVDNGAIGYTPGESRLPEIQASISSTGITPQEKIIENLDQYDDSHMIGYGEFTGLSDNTTYNLTISVSIDQEFKSLGSTTFTTPEIEIGFEFLSEEFEATNNSIKFVFEINEDQVVFDETAPTTTSNVYAEIYLSDSLVDTLNVVSFVESNVTGKLKGEGTFVNLSQSTAYTIKIYLNEQTNVIGFVTFSTTEFVQKITFNPLNPSDESISFSFEVALADIGYDPTSQEIPNVFATIKDADQFYKSLTLTQYEPIDNEHITVYGDFTELVPETTYTIDVYLDDESNLLGSATFTTVEKIRSVEFEGVSSGRDYVEFSFTVEKSDIDYDPTSVPAVHYEIRSTDETYYDDSWAERFVEVDDNTVRGTGSFSGLTANIAYELVVSLSTETGVIELGKKSFDTYHEFKFQKKPSADVSDTSTNFTISMRASYIGYISDEETPDVISHLSISVVEKDGGTPTTHRFASLSTYAEYVIAPSGEIGNLTPGTAYTVSVYYLPDNEDPELLGSAEFTTSGVNPGFSWGVIESTPSTASISFNISKTYLDYDTDPTAASRSLSIQVKKDDSLVDTLTIASLNPESENSDNLIGTATASNLTPETTYTLTLVRNSQVVGSSTTIETKKVAFNGVTIPTEVSFYSHQFKITLDFVDDPSNPQYDNLSIQFYDDVYSSADKYALGTAPISLASVTTEQTFSLPYTVDGGVMYYDFDFDAIGSFEILAAQVEIYHDDITFIDTDDPGVFNGLESDYLISVDASSGDFILPVKLLYTDVYDKFKSFYVQLCPTDGVTPSISAGASKEDNYQNLTYTGNDATSVVTYIQNGGTSGAEFNVKVYHFDDQQNPIWESSETVNIKVADTNIVYGGSLLSTELSQDSTSVQFGISYVAPVQAPTNPQIKFVDTSDSSLVYSYDFNFQNYPSVDMTNPAMSTGSAINDYASLKAAFEGKTFDVVISYYDGTSQTTKTIQTGVSFTFA